MQLRHATLKSNLESIMREGLLPSKSRGKRQAVWLHTASRTPWAILHMQSKWASALEDVVILTVEIPRSWLTRHQAGLWYCGRVISPRQIINRTDGTVYAVSPVQDNWRDTMKIQRPQTKELIVIKESSMESDRFMAHAIEIARANLPYTADGNDVSTGGENRLTGSPCEPRPARIFCHARCPRRR